MAGSEACVQHVQLHAILLPVLAARAAGAPTSSPTTNKEAEAKMKD
jgi:hypothetical protein